MWTFRRKPVLTGRPKGIAAIQSVMVLSVCLVILLGMQFLWNPKYGGPDGLIAAVQKKILIVLNGGKDDGGLGGSSTGGGNSAGGGNSDGGNGSDNPNGDPGPSDGSAGKGGDSDADSGKNGTDGGGDSSDDKPKSGGDDGHVDPLWEEFPKVLAEALADRVVERRKEAVEEFVKDVKARATAANTASEAAARQLEQALKDPDLLPSQRLALENQAAAARIESHNARIAAENAEEASRFSTKLNEQFSRSVALVGANQTLMDADRKRQELIKQGQYDEAWRVSVGGALRAVSEVATGFTDKLPGIGGSIASEAINTAAEMAGRELADNSFPAMVDLSHWLYGQSWWPKDRKPRFPPGYRPPAKN